MSQNKKELFSLEGKKVFVAGHNGMVGNALLRRLSKVKCDILTVEKKHLDLKNYNEVNEWFSVNKPQVVFLAAAKVGGIYANETYPVEFLYDNLAIQNSVISASYNHNTEKLMFLGSSCIYPREAELPLKEDSLLTGVLEKTNEAYALAKIAGLKLCSFFRKQHGADFISVMPTNLYGPGDNFDPKNSHVVAALIAKFYDAVKNNKKEIIIWGSGKPMREFLHVDDAADALFFIMQNYSDEQHINIGTGKEISINEFASLVKEISGWKGTFKNDLSYPDGTLRKVLDISKIKQLGWEAKIGLKEGIKKTYTWYSKFKEENKYISY